MKVSATIAKLLIFVYGLSIAGYALLDGTHEILHTLKSSLHHHDSHHDHSYNPDHHVEDHQDVFTPVEKSVTDSKSPVKIFNLLLFYHPPFNYLLPTISTTLKGNGLLEKLFTLTKAPLTPPPMR